MDANQAAVDFTGISGAATPAAFGCPYGKLNSVTGHKRSYLYDVKIDFFGCFDPYSFFAAISVSPIRIQINLKLLLKCSSFGISQFFPFNPGEDLVHILDMPF